MTSMNKISLHLPMAYHRRDNITTTIVYFYFQVICICIQMNVLVDHLLELTRGINRVGSSYP